MNKRILLLMLGIPVIFTSCNWDKTTPGYTYMDDMYRSPSLETYSAADSLPNGMSALVPVEGTVPRGYIPYEIPNTNEGYQTSLKNEVIPKNFAELNPEEGKKLYEIFCSACHGTKGDGQGILAQREKINGVPAYKDREITAGSVYHVIMHGKGIMGSHASQLTYEERWKIISYVMKLRQDQDETPPPAVPAA